MEDADPNPPVKTEQQFWGLRGLDDAILRRIDNDGDGEYGPYPDLQYYQLTDSSFSVIAHVDFDSGWEWQWMSYDAYGNMKVLHPADFDGDGLVTYPGDHDAFYDAYNDTPPRPSADLSGDGAVTSLDESIFWDRFISGYYSNGQFQEVRIGYAGYVRDPLMGTLLARHRWYDPVSGRWLTRDPAGYVDGLSLYLFVKGNPLGLVDPMGLEGVTTWEVMKRMPRATFDTAMTPVRWAGNQLFGSKGSPELSRQMEAGIRQREEIARELRDEPMVNDAARQHAQDVRRFQREGMPEVANAGDEFYGSGLVAAGAAGVAAGKVLRRVAGAGDTATVGKSNAPEATATPGGQNPPGATATKPNMTPNEAYNRQAHYGNTPTQADRKAVGAAAGEVVDHNPPLVKRYYEGDPAAGEKPGSQMTPAERRQSANDRNRMQVQPQSESNVQGAEMSQYSREQRSRFRLPRFFRRRSSE